MKQYMAVNQEYDYRLHYPITVGNDIVINLQYFLSDDNVAFFPHEKTITLKDIADKPVGMIQEQFVKLIEEMKNGYLLG